MGKVVVVSVYNNKVYCSDCGIECGSLSIFDKSVNFMISCPECKREQQLTKCQHYNCLEYACGASVDEVYYCYNHYREYGKPYKRPEVIWQTRNSFVQSAMAAMAGLNIDKSEFDVLSDDMCRELDEYFISMANLHHGCTIEAVPADSLLRWKPNTDGGVEPIAPACLEKLKQDPV